MTKMKVKYVGSLRTECEHIQSGTTIITDAPLDNQGKGEAFSPTDLCATALASCIITTMAIYAQTHNMKFENAEAEAVKTMDSDPRRIGKIEVIIKIPGEGYSEKEKKILERVANACPVHKSFSEGMIQDITIEWV